MKRLGASTLIILLGCAWLAAQGGRPASPAGSSATQVGGKYTTPAGADEPLYSGALRRLPAVPPRRARPAGDGEQKSDG